MIFVTIVNLIEQMLVFKAQYLILQESHVGFLIFNFLETLFLFGVIANQMIVFTLHFFQMVVDLENFDFSSKILSYAVVGASKINKSIPFYNWAFWVSKWRVIFICRFVDQGSCWQIFMGLNRNGLFRETTGEEAVRKITCWSLLITIQVESWDARFISSSLFLSSRQPDAEHLMQTWFTNFYSLLLALLVLYFHIFF
jgi:hypothetical protein